MKLQQFNGGLNTRIAAHLVNPTEAVKSVNVDFTAGPLTPIHKKYAGRGISTDKYSYYYIAQDQWVSSPIYRDYLEYKEILYYTEVNAYPKKFNGTMEQRLGIISPDAAPNVNDVLVQPGAPTAVTLTQTAVGNIHAQEDNGEQVTLEYLLVNVDSYGLISVTLLDSLALTGADTNISVEVSVTGRVNSTRVYRKYRGIYRHVNTITALLPTVVDAVEDIAYREEYSDYGLTGTYQYVLTYYNSADGAESMPSPISAEVILAGGVCKLTTIPVSTDPQVDKRRLYRVGGTLTSFALVAEFDNVVTSYDDAIRDLDIDGRLLDTSYNNEAPDGLKYLTEAYGVLFGALGDKLYYSRQGLPDAWPSVQYFDYEADITGIGVVPNGVLVFTKFRTYIIVGTSPEKFVSDLVDASQGCLAHQSIQPVKGRLAWVSSDGICLSAGGPAEVLSRNKLGKLSLIVENAVTYDDVYYVHQTNGTTLALDFRFGAAFTEFSFGVSRLVVANDVLYGYSVDALLSLQIASEVEEFTYWSPKFIENEYSNRKTYKHFYMRSEGTITVQILIDDIEVLNQTVTGTETHDLIVPQDTQDGYALQFRITGTGTIYEIEYKAMSRKNGR